MLQPVEYLRISLLDIHPCKGSDFLDELSFCIHKVYERYVVLHSHIVVILAVSRRDMDYSGTVRQGDEISVYDEESPLFRCVERYELLVVLSEELLPEEFPYDFMLKVLENCSDKLLCKYEDLVPYLHLCICKALVDGKCCV